MNSLKRYINLIAKNKNLDNGLWVLTAAGIFAGSVVFPRSAESSREGKGALSKGLFSDDPADPSNAEDFTLLYPVFIPIGKKFIQEEYVYLSDGASVFSFSAVLAWGTEFPDPYPDIQEM